MVLQDDGEDAAAGAATMSIRHCPAAGCANKSREGRWLVLAARVHQLQLPVFELMHSCHVAAKRMLSRRQTAAVPGSASCDSLEEPLLSH